MGGFNLQQVVSFLDEFIIFSSSLVEHEIQVKYISDFVFKLFSSRCNFLIISETFGLKNGLDLKKPKSSNHSLVTLVIIKGL